MADTERTLAALQVLLKDNLSFDISAQDVRDMLVSLASPNFGGGTPGWKDLIAPFSSAKASPQNSPTFEAWEGAIYGLSFSPTQMNQVTVNPYHVGHDYMVQSGMHFHVHWMPSTTAIGTVRWGVEYSYAQRDGVFTAPQTIYFEEATTGEINKHFVTEHLDGLFSGGLIEADTLIKARVFRDATHANDTYPDKVWGEMCDLHFESEHETTPNKVAPFYA